MCTEFINTLTKTKQHERNLLKCEQQVELHLNPLIGVW